MRPDPRCGSVARVQANDINPGPCSLGIDLGGTHARAAVVDASGRLLSTSKGTLTDRSPEAVVEAISHAVQAALEAVPSVDVVHCGVGVAAQLEPGSGRVLVAPNLGWREVPFGALLAAKLKQKVRVVNDLTAAAWGEHRAGAGKGVEDVYVLFVGSGVGSAIIAGGKLLHGATGVAGELGHIKVVRDGRLCGCGEHGCLEAYVGGHNLIAQMKEAVKEAGSRGLLMELAEGDLEKLNPAILEQAALGEDPLARRIYDQACRFLGMAAANQVTVLNPARLILGGGVLSHCPGMVKQVKESVFALASQVSRKHVEVCEAALGDDSGLIGAALLATEQPG